MAPADSLSDLTHITVEPDEDEIVIFATPEVAADSITAPEVAADLIVETDDAAVETDEAAAAPAFVAPSDSGSDQYRETTLEDLQRTPMPAMQRGVLVGIGLLVIACIVIALI